MLGIKNTVLLGHSSQRVKSRSMKIGRLHYDCTCCISDSSIYRSSKVGDLPARWGRSAPRSHHCALDNKSVSGTQRPDMVEMREERDLINVLIQEKRGSILLIKRDELM